MLCINLIFKYGETMDKNKIVNYIKNTEGHTPILEKIKGVDTFFSIKYLDKKIDTIVRIIDITKCKLKISDINKILDKLSMNKDIDKVINLYCYYCSATEPGSTITQVIDTIKGDIDDNYILFIGDKDKVNKNKCDSIVIKSHSTLKSNSILFIDEADKIDIINIARRIAGIKLLNEEWERYENELLKSFDEYIVKLIYIYINKIKLKNRSEMFEKIDGDITDDESLNVEKKYLDAVYSEVDVIEEAINNLIESYRSKFKFKEGNFEIYKYEYSEELEDDESKIGGLYKDLIEKKKEKKGSILNRFKGRRMTLDTNTEKMEKFIIEEGFKAKLNIQRSMEKFNEIYLRELN